MKLKRILLNILKIIFINLTILFGSIFFIEILLKIKKNEPIFTTAKYPIPKLLCDRKIKYDVSRIFNQTVKSESLYERNKLCYRSYSNDVILPKILVIGGSTTDERYITEGKTFVDLLDKKFSKKFDFINGGIDGQSSYGHLFSIKNWHSKALSKENVKEVVFYLGINDHLLIYENKTFDRNNSLLRKVYDSLDRNSFFYSLVKGIYLSKKLPRNFSILAAHTEKFNFVETQEIKKIKLIKNKNNYEEAFKKLMLATTGSFSNASIKVVQQQIPGCKFIDQYSVIDRHGEESDICQNLGSVFYLMERTIKDLPPLVKSKISIHKMYLSNILEDDDVYDVVHSNYSGSEKIANYIESLYK